MFLETYCSNTWVKTEVSPRRRFCEAKSSDVEKTKGLKMNWTEILYQVKKKLTYLAIFLAVGFIALWFLADKIILRIKADLLPKEATLIVTSPMEYVMVKIQISLILGVLIALPIFAAILLRRANIKIGIIWLIFALALFGVGFSFTYFFLLPLAIKILTSFALEAGIETFFSLSQFILFAALTTVIFSFIFELPLVVSWLAIKGIVSVATLKEKRKHVYVGVFIVAAIITADPTPFSQILLAIPLIFLYEVSILAAKIFGKKAHAIA